MNNKDRETLQEVAKVLDEAYQHYFAHSDGHHKSSEGHITVELSNFFERQDEQALTVKEVQIYSYVFGSDRMHYFKSPEDALAAVRAWRDKALTEEF